VCLIRPGLAVAVATSLFILVSGCNKSEDKAGATQVAAQVNAEEITLHQVNVVLARTAGVPPEEGARVKRQILDRLIDQQLAVQQARRRKLDRSPEVVHALEEARAEILARAFATEIARSQSKPTAAEVSSYYSAHPELFAQRRLFLIEEISIAALEGSLTGLAELISKARSMQEVAGWLESKSVKFVEYRGVRAAEQIPLEMLPTVHAMKEGEIRLINGRASGKIHVVHVLKAKSAAVFSSSSSISERARRSRRR
jgi:EpsD family peptidyl-prolyl cis-trans isomerase